MAELFAEYECRPAAIYVWDKRLDAEIGLSFMGFRVVVKRGRKLRSNGNCNLRGSTITVVTVSVD